jgi:hypothetical protein
VKEFQMRRRSASETVQEPADERRTRRGLLAGAAGALGLLAGETILSATPAQAASDLVLGQGNVAPTTTTLDTSLHLGPVMEMLASGGGEPTLVLQGGVDPGYLGTGLWVTSGHAGSYYPGFDALHAITGNPANSGSGFYGIPAAVRAESTGGSYGVIGSTSSPGLTDPAAVYGVNGTGGPGVMGQSSGGAGVYGLAQSRSEGVYAQSGASRGTSPGATRNGVHGVTDSPADAGVWGEAVAGGNGVSGSTSTKGTANPAGVYGVNTGTGAGVKGYAANGTGVFGSAGPSGVGIEALNSGGGVALAVSGSAVFNRAGLISVTAPATSAAADVPGPLTPNSLVLALLQTMAPGIWVTAAVPDPAAGQIKIYLNAAPSNPATVQIAWFVIN